MTGGPTGGAVLPDALTDLSLRQLLSFRAVADEGSLPRGGRRPRLHAVGGQPARHGARGGARRPAVRSGSRAAGRSSSPRPADCCCATWRRSRTASRRHAPTCSRTRPARPARCASGVYQSVGTRVLPAIIGRFARGVAQRRDPADRGQQRPGAVRAPGPGRARPLVRRAAPPGWPVRGGRAAPRPVRPGHRRGRRRWPASWASRRCELIGEQRLIGFRSCRSTRWVEEHMRARGAEPNFVFRSEDNGTVQAMAGAGLGTALVPLLAVDTTDPAVADHPDRPAGRVGSPSSGTAIATGRRPRRRSSRSPWTSRRGLSAGARRAQPGGAAPGRACGGRPCTARSVPEPAGILRRCPTTRQQKVGPCPEPAPNP